MKLVCAIDPFQVACQCNKRITRMFDGHMGTHIHPSRLVFYSNIFMTLVRQSLGGHRRTYMQYVYFHSRVTRCVNMILYAKSSLELIVNNRIGKVGIQRNVCGVGTNPLTPTAIPSFSLYTSLSENPSCVSFATESARPNALYWLSVRFPVCPPICSFPLFRWYIHRSIYTYEELYPYSLPFVPQCTLSYVQKHVHLRIIHI